MIYKSEPGTSDGMNVLGIVIFSATMGRFQTCCVYANPSIHLREKYRGWVLWFLDLPFELLLSKLWGGGVRGAGKGKAVTKLLSQSFKAKSSKSLMTLFHVLADSAQALTFFSFYFFSGLFRAFIVNHFVPIVRNTNTVCSEEVGIIIPGQTHGPSANILFHYVASGRSLRGSFKTC